VTQEEEAAVQRTHAHPHELLDCNDVNVTHEKLSLTKVDASRKSQNIWMIQSSQDAQCGKRNILQHMGAADLAPDQELWKNSGSDLVQH
jgi:hypothetical protein